MPTTVTMTREELVTTSRSVLEAAPAPAKASFVAYLANFTPEQVEAMLANFEPKARAGLIWDVEEWREGVRRAEPAVLIHADDPPRLAHARAEGVLDDARREVAERIVAYLDEHGGDLRALCQEISPEGWERLRVAVVLARLMPEDEDEDSDGYWFISRPLRDVTPELLAAVLRVQDGWTRDP